MAHEPRASNIFGCVDEEHVVAFTIKANFEQERCVNHDRTRRGRCARGSCATLTLNPRMNDAFKRGAQTSIGKDSLCEFRTIESPIRREDIGAEVQQDRLAHMRIFERFVRKFGLLDLER